jgi:alpha,alpha-trehalase
MNDWCLIYDGYEPEQERLRETLCALGNGYFVTRGAGTDCSAGPNHYPGTYFAGVYNRLRTDMQGQLIENEDLVNWTNWLPLTICVEDEAWFSIDEVDLLSYRQELRLDEGILYRDFRFRDVAGRVTRWEERRFVGMHDPHLAGLAVNISAENWSGQMTVRSALDGTVRNKGVERYRELNSQHTYVVSVGPLDDETIMLMARTKQSRIEVAQVARTRVFRDAAHVDAPCTVEQRDDWIGQDLTVELHQGQTVTVEKLVAIYTSRDTGKSEAGYQAQRKASDLARFDAHLARHAVAWNQLWQEFDLEIEALEANGSALRLRVHIFHLLQSVSRFTVDTDAGVPARGWHGEAYRGHVFWDEIFILPLLNLRMPLVTRALLRYRYHRMDEARRAARAAGFDGAMFPWQSGSDGREESQKVHLNPESGHWIPDNTHLQRHVSASIAYCIWQYYEVTGDQEALTFFGADMLIEIARFWASLTEYNETLERYEIKGVMGPDEFHTDYPDREMSGLGLNNNTYTNVMAAWVLARAGDVLELLSPHQKDKVCARLGVTTEELENWDRISRGLRIVFHEDGVLSQFEGYEDLLELDWNAYRKAYPDIQRLDRILEKEGDTPNRYKLSKQADVLMLFYLFSAEELGEIFARLGYPFDPEVIPRTIDYYLKRTSHGSTLSHIVHSWVVARSDRERSWQGFLEALSSDIDDIQGGTTAEGIHLGAMAGTVDMVHRCYTGIEARNNVLHFAPMLPPDLRRLSISVRYRHHRIFLVVDHETLQIKSMPLKTNVPAITVSCRGDQHELGPGEQVEFSLRKQTE